MFHDIFGNAAKTTRLGRTVTNEKYIREETKPMLYESVSKSFRTGRRLERELQMVQLSAIRCGCIAILWDILVSFAAIILCVACQLMFIVYLFRYRLSPETFGYTLVYG
jgi:hypothetical protein